MAKFAGEHIHCIVTLESGATEHHVLTQKAHPELRDAVWNRLPVRQQIHNEIHAKGLLWAAQRYPAIADWLDTHGWRYDAILMRWHHELE